MGAGYVGCGGRYSSVLERSEVGQIRQAVPSLRSKQRTSSWVVTDCVVARDGLGL